MGVQAHDPGSSLDVVEEDSGAPGIFGGHERHRTERLSGPIGQIAKVAEGGCDDVESPATHQATVHGRRS